MGHRKQQLATLVVASVVLQFSVVLLAVQLALPPNPDGSSLFLIIMGVLGLILGLTGVLVAAFALLGGRRAVRPAPPPPAPLRVAPEDGNSTVINPKPQSPPSSMPAGQWTTATTPWPRANEADPEGTLIRPPHR